MNTVACGAKRIKITAIEEIMASLFKHGKFITMERRHAFMPGECIIRNFLPSILRTEENKTWYR